MIRSIGIEDGVTVFTDSEPVDDLMLLRLKKSGAATCKHPNRINHSAGISPDTGEWYHVYNCPDCKYEWTSWDAPSTEAIP